MLYILTPIFCVSLLSGAVFSFSLNNNKVTANAATAETINELTINGTGAADGECVFKQENLNTFYSKILNSSSAKYVDLASSLSGTDTYNFAGTVNKMIRSDEINGGAMLKVKFGGFEWQVTSVTTSNDGDVIATLWLTDNNPTVPKSSYTSSTSYTTTTNQTYSSTIYGTSYIRTKALNAGGDYVIVNSQGQGSLSTTPLSQSVSHIFAKFTMPTATNNLTKYIVKPKDVLYQEQESFAGDGATSLNCLNDAYGTPYTGSWHQNLVGGVNKYNYNVWKDDYLWLPSVTEIGGRAYSNSTTSNPVMRGVWNIPNLSFSARDVAWARSTYNSSWEHCVYYTNDGVFNEGTLYVEAGVRPALHLNLTKAQSDAASAISKPSANSNFSYNGSEQTYTPLNFDANTMEITGNKATTVGDYTCSVTPKAGYAWTGYDKSAVDIPWKILKGDPNVTCTFVDTSLENADRLLLNQYPTMPPITNSHASATEGTLAWNSGETPKKDQTEYGWTFTPTDSNYNTVQSTKTINFEEARVTGIEVVVLDGVTIYDRYDEGTYSSLTDYLKSCIKVNVLYEGDTKTPLISSAYTITTSDISVTAGDEQQKTISVRVTSSDAAISNRTGSVTATVKKAVITSMNIYPVAEPAPLVYPVTLDAVKANYEVYLGWNFSDRELLVDSDNISVALQDGTTDIKAGTSAFIFTYTDGNLSKTSDPVSVSIANGTYNLSGITFGGLTMTYDGSSHKIEISGTLPEGVSVVYSVAGQTATEFTNAGTYEYNASFTHSNPNYNAITTTKAATLKIEQADYPDADRIKFENKTVTHTGGAQSIEAMDVPAGVTVTYVYNGTEQSAPFEFTDLNESGYEVTAKFAHTNPNYKAIANKTATLVISAKPTYNEEGLVFAATGAEGSGNSFTATYDPTVTVEIVLTGSVVDKDGAEVTVTPEYGYFKKVNGEWTECTAADLKGAGEYKIVVGISTGDESYAAIADREVILTIAKAEYDIPENAFVNKTVAYTGEAFDPEGWIDTSALPEGVTVTYTCDGDLTAVGNYLVTAHFTGDGDNYEAIPDRTATLTISTAALVLDVEFEDSSVPYDGENHTITVTGTLPAGVTVEYFVGETPFTGATETGKYVVTAKFTVDLTIYNQPEDMTAELEITAVAYDMTGVTFENGAFVYDGAAHSIFVGGAALPEWITVEYEGNEVTEVGAHTVTAKFVSTNSNYLPIADMAAEIVISKAKVSAPVFKGGLSYTGNNITLTAENFNGYDAEIMTLVETDSTPLKAKNAGDYTAIFVLLDPDRYEWNTVSAAGKKVFAAVVYEGESAATAVKWSISKAVLTATQAEGELPVFASESYAGAISDVVTFRYFTDAECTQEVAADKLERLHDYYVVAEIADEVKDNFELELSASKFTKPFSYTTPEGELTFWEKVVKFMTAERMGLVVWLWIVIAVVALILLITIIALAVKSRKKKRIREEQRLAEEKAERLAREERDREERRLEREERMARMSQQQAMPQMMMPQMMPQTQPQSQTVQPVMGGNGGTVSEAQFMQMQAELAALKAEQSAKEMAMRAEMTAREAAMKAEQVAMKAEQNAVLRSDVNALRSGEQVGGISVDAMTEIMTAALKNVLSTATQQAIAGQNAQPAQLTDGAAPATPQVPPDAVMTTVTTTKIDTTKKTAQGTHDTAQAAIPTRSFVPPMPVDDGRVFDVGGFYKPADPATDFNFDEEDNKD